MAIKTFTTGEVLTASDTNTYLANAGLVYVSSGTFSNASSFDVTGFTTTYNRWELVLNSATAASAYDGYFSINLIDGTTVRNTSYYGAGWYSAYNATSGVSNNANNATAINLDGCGASGGAPSQYRMTITGVNSGNRFTCFGSLFDTYALRSINFGYMRDVGDTNTAIRFDPSGANVTGSWVLYGYRKA